jgi:hypothetical protein
VISEEGWVCVARMRPPQGVQPARATNSAKLLPAWLNQRDLQMRAIQAARPAELRSTID